jgi:hypothetical protein
MRYNGGLFAVQKGGRLGPVHPHSKRRFRRAPHLGPYQTNAPTSNRGDCRFKKPVRGPRLLRRLPMTCCNLIGSLILARLSVPPGHRSAFWGPQIYKQPWVRALALAVACPPPRARPAVPCCCCRLQSVVVPACPENSRPFPALRSRFFSCVGAHVRQAGDAHPDGRPRRRR